MTRKRFGAGFKARVAIEVLKNNMTIAELSSKHGVHPTQIQAWKSELITRSEDVFSKKDKKYMLNEKRLAELERKIGQLTIENDFLKKNLT